MQAKSSQCVMLGSGVCKHAEFRGSGGMLPRKILKFTILETAFDSSFNRYTLASQDIQDFEIYS